MKALVIPAQPAINIMATAAQLKLKNDIPVEAVIPLPCPSSWIKWGQNIVVEVMNADANPWKETAI